MTAATVTTDPTNAPGVRPVAMVTGGSAGIGLASAMSLVRRGWRVLITGRDQGRLDAAVDGLAEAGSATGGEASAFRGDVAVAGESAAAVAAAVERYGRLDALVNNAGAAPLKPMGETSRGDYEASVAVNLLGPAEAIAAAWPIFRQQHDGEAAGGGGRIVNVTTMGTADPFPGFAAYAAAKSGAASLARSAKNEGAEIGVLAFNVAPGAVETAMLRSLFDTTTVPAEFCLSPTDVGAVVAACACGERDADNGKTIYLSQGPEGVAERVAEA